MSGLNAVNSNLLYKQQAVEDAFANGLSERIRADFPQVEKISNISPEEFREKYVLKNRPVILTGLCNKWSNQEFFNLDYFSNKCGNAEILINLYDSKLVNNGTMNELIRQIKTNRENSPVYLQEWWFQDDIEDFMDDFGHLAHFEDDWGKKILGFMNHTLWIGSKGCTTPIHEDTIHFNLWSAQLFGKKEWFLFHKDAFLYSDKNGQPDYERLLADPTSEPMSCVLEEGDILYMPHKWWHRTDTLEDAGSLNTPYVTEEIVQPYMKGLFTLPMILALKGQELSDLNKMRYNVTFERVRKMASLMDFDPDYIIHAIKNAHAEKAA